MKLTQKEYEEFFKGVQIYDCAVRSKNIYSFVGIDEKRIEDLEPDKKLINFFVEDPVDDRIGSATYTGFRFPNLAIARSAKEQAVMVSSNGGVAVLGSGDDGMEQAIPLGSPDTPLLSDAEGLATIEGYIYAVGGWRSVCRRESANHWVSLRKNLPLPTDDTVLKSGFDSIDGFSAKDIYCAGARADVWHYDGERWSQCPIPTNIFLRTVCCAGDGYVYIGGQSGSVVKGRGDEWKVIYRGNMTLPFKDMVWYQDRVWCTSDYGVWQIVDNKVIQAELPSEIYCCAGNLSVGDGVLLLAGMYGAAVFDGKKWELLIDPEGWGTT